MQVGDPRSLAPGTWTYPLAVTKTEQNGGQRHKPLKGEAAAALEARLAVAGHTEGPLFRRVFRGGRIGTAALGDEQVARIVQRRARVAGLPGDWAAHSLRSGFVTEAGRQGVPLGEAMALTDENARQHGQQRWEPLREPTTILIQEADGLWTTDSAFGPSVSASTSK